MIDMATLLLKVGVDLVNLLDKAILDQLFLTCSRIYLATLWEAEVEEVLNDRPEVQIFDTTFA